MRDDASQVYDESECLVDEIQRRQDEEATRDPEIFFRRYKFRRGDPLTRASIIEVQRAAGVHDSVITAMALLKLIPLRGRFNPRHNFYFAVAGAIIFAIILAIFGFPSIAALTFGREAGWLGVLASAFGAVAVYAVFIEPWRLQSELLGLGVKTPPTSR